jgi:hypothetical protein
MAEPTTPYVIALGAITLTGSFFGMPADALLVGLFGGFVALRYGGQMSKLGLTGSLSSSTLMAGQFSNVASRAASHYADWLSASDDSLRLACAFALGLGAQVVIPWFLKIIGNLGVKEGQK